MQVVRNILIRRL